MTELKTGDWVLIADSEKALFLENVGDEKDWHLQVRRKREQENPSTAEQGADRPGRMPDDGRGMRSAMDDTDWHALEKERFAEDLAEAMLDRVRRGDFRRIVVAADPRTLGNLREALDPEAAKTVIAEIDKDLTNMPIDEIETLVSKAIG